LMLEVMVAGFYDRSLFSVCIFSVGIWGVFNNQISSGLKITWFASTSITAIFPLLPISAGDINPLVYGGGLLIAVIGIISLVKSLFFSTDEEINNNGSLRWRNKLQILIVVVSSFVVYSTDQSLASLKGLPQHNALLSWSILIYSLISITVLPKDANFYEVIILALLSLASPFVLLSISYEVLFYSSQSWMLLTWILIEEKKLRTETTQRERNAPPSPVPPVVRVVDVGDTRIALFSILFCLVAFFGTGNVASMASFEISSTYRFTTVFQPFLMTILLILKILLPIFLIAIICNIITRIINLPVMASFYITIILTNIMGFNFFLLIKDIGSWREIGMSIGHYIGTNAFIVFYILIFGISQIVLRNGIILVKRHAD